MTTTYNRRRFGAMTAIGLAVAATAGMAQDDPIRIGAINPYSGPYAQYGDEVTKGFELAAKQANANGGVAGRMVEIVRGNATRSAMRRSPTSWSRAMVARSSRSATTGSAISASHSSPGATIVHWS